MQDRFRFRVWYKSFGEIIPKMLYDAEQTYDYMYGEPETIPAKSFGSVLDNEEEYIVMQCTGLKDINGKLIYEGDIVQETSIDAIYKIGYKKCAFYLESEDHICYFNELAKAFSEKRLKLIGNIYQNKELFND